MTMAALVLWGLTAIGGATMATLWILGRGPSQYRQGHSRISPARIGTHVALAVAGLVLWVLYLSTDATAWGWLAFALLPLAASFGLLMFVTWLSGRRYQTETTTRPAEQRFPTLIVAGHGLLAVVTVVAVFLALAT